MAVKEKIRVRLKSYDHQLVDTAADKIVEAAKRTGARVSGPIPLPTEKEVITILRAVHKYKDFHSGGRKYLSETLRFLMYQYLPRHPRTRGQNLLFQRFSPAHTVPALRQWHGIMPSDLLF